MLLLLAQTTAFAGFPVALELDIDFGEAFEIVHNERKHGSGMTQSHQEVNAVRDADGFSIECACQSPPAGEPRYELKR
jgi:hypothetical protein